MEPPEFGLASFCAEVGAAAKERSPLRQDLVRGLKDWYTHLYGYDRYGAETAFLLPQRMNVPKIYGFAVLRILADRRISAETKARVARRSLDVARYPDDMTIPYGLFVAVQHLSGSGSLSATDLRYALVLTAGKPRPFEGMDKKGIVAFLGMLLAADDLAPEGRALWSHSLIARHDDGPGAADLIRALLKSEHLPVHLRRELAWSWVNIRQPRIEPPPPALDDDPRSYFVAEHLPFWVAHAPSWPAPTMVRHGLVWLARLGEDPLLLSHMHIGAGGPFSEQLQLAVADIVAEQHQRMPAAETQTLIERGMGSGSSIQTRKKFYRLGADLFGREYLERATHDTAGSVRQWASRELQKS